MRKRIAGALFAAALACFVAPWFAVELGGRELTRFSGTELVFGTAFTAASPAAFLGSVGGQMPAQFAAICGLAALALGLFGRKASGVAATSAATGALAGVLVESVLFPNILRLRPVSTVEITAQTGYYLALLLFLAGAIAAAPTSFGAGGKSDN